jgi:hypothetical protein
MHAVKDLEKWRKSNRELSEHPDYPIESWVRAVDDGQTTLDYWDWMLSQARVSDRRAQEAAEKADEERTDQLMVEGNLFFFVNGSTDYGEVIKTAPFFVVPVIKGYDYSNSPMPLQVLTATNLCKAIEQSPRMAAGAIIYGYGASTLDDANLILHRLKRYQQQGEEHRHAARKKQEEQRLQLAIERRQKLWGQFESILGVFQWPMIVLSFVAMSVLVWYLDSLWRTWLDSP